MFIGFNDNFSSYFINKDSYYLSLRVYLAVVVVIFQIAFRTEIYINNFFYFLKIIFNISTSKRFKKYKLHSILIKKN